jgi:CheY-like chemotaxis protein
VLVLEDEPTIRNSIVRGLQLSGYTVLSAASPVDAIQIGADHELPIHLLITDFGLHAVNGWQVADLLLRDRPDLPVLYISGHAEADVVPRNRRGHGVAFLQKPFALETLMERVRELLG